MDTKLVQVGNYKFTGKVLGKGSFAVVREALHTPMSFHVSVKIMDLKKCNNYLLKNHLRETNILQKLYHPFILRLFETMKYNNMYYIVTEMVQGGDLCTFIQEKKGKVEEIVTRKFSRQIASALHYLHMRGIVHRDLKLENVLLDSAKRNVKLVDFGLTNIWSLDSPLKTLCGSPEYCAPELFVYGTEYGPEVDMWAFGVIMFALAAGRLPFPCLSAIMKISEKRIQFLKIIKEGLSEAQMKLIRSYSLEFTLLIKGLMNPDCEVRLTIKDVFRDPWITNRDRWVDVPYESLDANDTDNIIQQLGLKLKTTPERVKAELKLRPTGEIAGYFNIMIHREVQERHDKMSPIKFATSQNSSFFQNSFSNNRTCKQTLDHPINLYLLGNAMKINEVSVPITNRFVQRKVSTPLSATTNETSVKRTDYVGKVVLPKIKSLNSNCSTPLSPVKGNDAIRTEKKSIPINTALRKRLTIGRVILPSKFKVTPSAKPLLDQKQSWQKV